jgi:electron transfer flavoprotein alpha subunit
MALNRIWVYAEVSNGEQSGQVAPTSLEMLTKARQLGENVEAICGGPVDEAAAADLGAHGAARVYATGDLGDSLPAVPVAAALHNLVQEGDVPDLIMLGTTYEGRDVAARLSVALDKPVITNNVEVSLDGDGVIVTEPIFGGTKLVRTRFAAGTPYMALFRPKSFEAEPSGGGPAEVVSLDVPEAGREGSAKLLSRHVEESSGPKLDEADVVVSGGRGLGEAANYSMIEELASLLKAAPGATRAIVDAGWVPYSYQVGQTGKVVKPTVYIAAGISGATQHLVGMKGSKNIIAVNKDPEAPIFQVSDLGIVGDVHKVLPKLIDALKRR